ncbi:MAG TPA: hypothetical protein VJ851_04400 [Jatrophihabitans sp.]|nr:hypothetical protein [Jatrophihabitans sp.]
MADAFGRAVRSPWLRRTLLLGAATAGLWLAGSLGHAGSAEAAAPVPVSPAPAALTQPVLGETTLAPSTSGKLTTAKVVNFPLVTAAIDRASSAVSLGLRAVPLSVPAAAPVPLPTRPVTGSLGSATAGPLPKLGRVRTATAGHSGHRAESSRRLSLPPTPGPNPAAPAGIPPAGGTNAGGTTLMTLLIPDGCRMVSRAGLFDRIDQHSPAPRERATAPAFSPD